MLKVFVYGTLKPNGKYYQMYCQGKTLQETKCWAKGRLFALPMGYPAIIEGDNQVFGYLLSFASVKDLENLDELEGYVGKNSPFNEYHRQKIMVYNDANYPLDEAWTYFMTEEKVKVLKGIFLPSGWWDEESQARCLFHQK
ncbi:gamma-glutamylcyclotransferase [Geminocystis sp. GBBB08]|uniref:gamma-glutamylcyclotransferase family protein n=1 Tax=Geminocystis sp. GBBB08 TaxID=2604140 RepID=UPI0027E28BFE|nr:gamma-glutamylcyclotransferase [Geminocystis sp. GBBB08]MBL1208639.1 gamma-glutamylcyclotransferase [Geminocystis sp. GBBB08]